MNIPLLPPLLFLLALTTTNPLAGAAAPAAPGPVVDTFGKPVRESGKYYVVPPSSLPYNISGLDVGAVEGRDCPRDVLVTTGYLGLTVSFTPVNPKKSVVRVSTDLNVAFNAESFCGENVPYVWKLDHYDASKRQWFVSTGGIVGKPGPKTVRNWFKIEKYEDGYKFVYCPSVCNNNKDCNKVECENIGMYKDKSSGYKRLFLSHEPYKVQFLQA